MKISFLKLDNSLITDNNIDSYQFRIYTYLLSLYNNDKGCSYPSLETMSTKLNIGLTTVKKAIKHLSKIGYITIEKQKAKIGNFNKYIPVHIISEIEKIKKVVDAGNIRTPKEVKESNIINNENIRFLRKKEMNVDSNEAIREMISLLNKDIIKEAWNIYKFKVESNKWQINTTSNFFRDAIDVYYKNGKHIPNKVFNFYKSKMNPIAVQPLPLDSNNNIPLDGQIFIDEYEDLYI